MGAIKCNILFKNDNKSIGTLQRGLNFAMAAVTAGENADYSKLSAFVAQFKNFTPSVPTQVKMVADANDSDRERMSSYQALMDNIEQAVNLWAQRPMNRTAAQKINIPTVLKTIYDALNLITDNSSETVVEDEEIKTETELLDHNALNLEAHLAEFYGVEAHDILESLSQDFRDMMTTAAYWNSNTGILVYQTNANLNNNIMEQKAMLFRNIVSYLQEKFPDNPNVQGLSKEMYVRNTNVNSPQYGRVENFNYSNYSRALGLFYSLVASQPDFKNDIQKAHSERILETERNRKTGLYKRLVTELMNDQQFASKVASKFASSHERNSFLNQLYTADHFSKYFDAVLEWVNKNGTTAQKDIIMDICSNGASILTAANSYTMLRHFDSYLQNTYGDEISIAKGTKDYENFLPDKYAYSRDTKHKRKDWQSEEVASSEKATSKLTRAILDSIRLYDYKTGEFLNRRLKGDLVISASHNLIDSLVGGKVSFLVKNNAALTAMKEKLKNLAITYHNSPVAKIQEMLQLLFEVEGRSNRTLAESMIGEERISDFDLSILKSLYDALFNENRPESLYSQIKSNVHNNNAITQNLLEDIAGYIDRNTPCKYLETLYDFDTGEVTIRAKKKFFNNQEMYRLYTNINTGMNQRPPKEVRALQDLYNMRITYNQKVRNNEGDYNSFNIFTVTIGGRDISLQIPSSLKGQIMMNNINGVSNMKFEVPGDSTFFDRMADIDLTDFRQKMLNLGPEQVLNGDDELLRQLLQFIDDNLGLGILADPSTGLRTLNTYKACYTPTDSFNNFLMPLVRLAMRASYVNKMYYEAADTELGAYLQLSGNPIFKFNKEDATAKLLTQRHHNWRFVIASYNDDTIAMWADAQSMSRGEMTKATTKDRQGNSIPNNSVAKLGSNLRYYLNKQYGTNTSSLLLVQQPSLLTDVFHDLEVTNPWGDSKSIKRFSIGELAYHAIFNKFWGRYLSYDGRVVIQPTTYADKTTFLNYELKTKFKDAETEVEYDLVEDSPAKLAELYRSTIGTFYHNIYLDSKNKLMQITSAWAAQHLDRINGNPANMDYRDIMHLMTEQDLVSTAQSLTDANGNHLEVEQHKDYRIIKDATGKSVVDVNELLEYNDNLFNDPEQLQAKLEEEKVKFLEYLLANGCSFQVLEGQDIVDHYTSDIIDYKNKSRNPIVTTILKYFQTKGQRKERIEFFKKWVDNSTGKLILARQGDKIIFNVSDNYDENQPVELNPFLSKFFYAEGFLSNTLRLSLTGSEINHKTRPGNLFSNAKKITTVENWNNLRHQQLDAQEFKEMKTILDSSLSIDDLNRKLSMLTSSPTPPSEKVEIALAQILELSYEHNTNTAQGTQFKRNVIIPATLEYCLEKSKEGATDVIKCAVIKDEQAPVYNYRGDHEGTIDACDGSAYITSFQCIMENRALQSQAVGFTKKPIWHHFDTTSGTAFLAKFATTTMTNEAMKLSLGKKKDLYKLFRKATNMQWQPSDNIDLTKSLIETTSSWNDAETFASAGNQSFLNWFRNIILGGQRLFYSNAYGDISEILTLNKTVTSDGTVLYYTLEKSPLSKTPVRKYHIFYDEIGPDGNVVEESKHITVNTWQAAVKELANHNNAHTINSLFELHAALGGIHCVDGSGNDSEFNNEVVVNFMTNIGQVNKQTAGGTKFYVDQTTYNQPLKQYHIGYIFNDTAVKNGAKNINQSTAWSDNSKLSWFNVDSDGLGMQMDADHDIINSELTEFSQVIAATSAYGFTYDQCHEIFEGLGRTAFQSSQKILVATDKFLEKIRSNERESALSDLYDAVGRIIFLNRSINDKKNLTNMIMQAVAQVFNKYSDHTKDEYKMPVSDNNIYGTFIATLASTITKNSIKRKHPGSGAVMVPAYNAIQYYEVYDKNGQVHKLFTKDVIARARDDYRAELVANLRASLPENGNKSFITTKSRGLVSLNRGSLSALIDAAKEFSIHSDYHTDVNDDTDIVKHLINTYLNKRAVQMPTFDDASFFMPSDIVEVIDESGKVIETVDLDSMEAYYAFKESAAEAESRTIKNPIDDNGAAEYLIASNPELAKIGTATEYREYLSSIFPGSKLPTVYWHGTASDFSQGFQSAKRTKGSGAPETGNEMYFAKQPETVLQYIPGINARVTDTEGYQIWSRLWWELRRILGNGRESENWKNEIIGADTVRQQIPNKKGIYDKKNNHGKTLKEIKESYGYKGKSDEKFFREVFGLDYGNETFNQWVARQRQVFEGELANHPQGLYPVLLDVSNPITEENQDTYYEEHRQLMSQAKQNKNDAIISNSALNEFGSDVVVMFKPNPKNVYFLGSAADVIAFQNWKQKHRFPKKARYRISATHPHNLRPSLIRWQYDTGLKDVNGNSVIRYMNYFDLAHVKDAYLNNIDTNNPAYRKQVQDALNNLHNGKYLGQDGQLHNIIAGSLENTEAELVMSNMYKDMFGIDDETLDQILTQGVSYFENKLHQTVVPDNNKYDVIFLRENGKNTMITINNVEEGEEIIEDKINPNSILVNNKDELVVTKNGQEIFEIGRWGNVSDVIYDTNDKRFVSKTGQTIDQNQYRIKNGQVQKRFDYVKRYRYTTVKEINGKSVLYTNTLYKIADVQTFQEALSAATGEAVSHLDAVKQQSSIISKLFASGGYKSAEVNYQRATSKFKPEQKEALREALNGLKSSYNARNSADVRALIQLQLDNLYNVEKFKKETAEFKQRQIKKLAQEQWVSFQDSLKFIAARIPAQTLQSFMAMRLVGWTSNSKNMAYVSHFQTYLQGSDYDIDKAYVMGQNYDNNAVYSAWSYLFDYSSLATLEESKKLPIPKGIKITEDALNGVDVTSKIQTLLSTSSVDPVSKLLITVDATEEQKVAFLRTFADIVRTLERNGGRFKYNHNVISEEQITQFIDTVNKHETYRAPINQLEGSFKNVASANIFAVAHDIRNRDQAYTAIALNLMRKAAENSPKGEQAAMLNMLNPLTKYIMQYQNLVGKSVIGITANAEKFWFNTYYYWTHMLRTAPAEELEYMKFMTTLSRVKGRSQGTQFDPALSSNTVTMIPDLDLKNQQIRDKLKEARFVPNTPEGDAILDSIDYKYVDQLISQMLSAATDNAKELILAKLNAGTNYAKMFLYLMINGYDLNDIAAFMTSPVAEFIDSRSAQNMFQAESAFVQPINAMNLATGRVSSNIFLHGNITIYGENDEGETMRKTVTKANSVKDKIIRKIYDKKKIPDTIRKSMEGILGVDENNPMKTFMLDDVMEALIQTVVVNPRILERGTEFNLLDFLGMTKDAEINSYLRYCQDLILQLGNVVKAYQDFLSRSIDKDDKGKLLYRRMEDRTREASFNYMLADVGEFKNIFGLSSEMSSIATGFLGLNQGLATDKVSMLRQLNKMRRVVTDRESFFNIKEKNLYNEVLTKDDSTLSKGDKQRKARLLKAKQDLIAELHKANPLLDESLIEETLNMAHKEGIMNNFDPVRMLEDVDYRNKVRDYLHIIKGMVNAIDMVYRIPHYAQIMECMKSLVIADKTLSAKSRMINTLVAQGENITDDQLRRIIRYVDECTCVNFMQNVKPVITHESVLGLDRYFGDYMTNEFDLSHDYGMAGFRRFVETDFLSYLKQNYKNNGLVKHLKKQIINGKVTLTTDIDLMNPDITTYTRAAFDEILRGASEFDQEKYVDNGSDDDYTIADILQLYNLLVHQNQYGSDRLTAIFDACRSQKNVLNTYLQFIGRNDQNYDAKLEYYPRDFYISSAPLVSPASLRFHTEPYVKMKDPVWDYVLMRYNPSDNSYYEEVLHPAFTDTTEGAENDVRKANYMDYCPIELPVWAKQHGYQDALLFKGSPDDAKTLNAIKTVLFDLTRSGRLAFSKENC